MALERYESRPQQTSSRPIDTGVSVIADVKSRGASMLAAELDKFSATLGKVGATITNRMAAQEGTRDALESTNKLNDALAKLDVKLEEANKKGDTKKVEELLAQKSEAITGASRETQKGSFFRLDRVYNEAANKQFADAFESSLPMIKAQARMISGDDPAEFSRVFKKYTDKMIDDAPTPELAAYMGATLVRQGSGVAAELTLNDYQKAKTLAIENSQAALMGLEEEIIATSEQTLIDGYMYQEGKNAVDYSPRLGDMMGGYIARVKSDVENGYIGEAEGQNKIQVMSKKIELSVFNANAQQAVSNGAGIDYMEKVAPAGSPLWLEKKDMFEKLLSNDIIMQNRLDAQEEAENNDISANKRDEYYSTGEYLTMDIESDPFLTFSDKVSLQRQKRLNQETSGEAYITDPSIIYTMDREAIEGLGVTNAVKRSLYTAWDKQDAFSKELEVSGIHTTTTKKIEDAFEQDVYKNIYDAVTKDEQKDIVINPSLMRDVEQARKEAAVEASQLPIPITNMKAEYARIYTEKLDKVQKTWVGKFTERDQLTAKIKELTERNVEITKEDNSSIMGQAMSMFSTTNAEALAKSKAKLKAEQRKNEQLIKEMKAKRKQLGFK